MEAAVESDDLAGRHPRIDPAAALEHQPDAGAVLASGPCRVCAEDPDLAAIRPAVALEDLDGRRLARSVRPQEREDLATADAEGHIGQDPPPVVALAQAVDLDRGAHASGGGRHELPEISPYWRSKSASRTSPIWIERRIPDRSTK